MSSEFEHDQPPKANSRLKLLDGDPYQHSQPIGAAGSIEWAPSVLCDIKSFAERNGYIEIAREIEVARLRIEFLISSQNDLTEQRSISATTH